MLRIGTRKRALSNAIVTLILLGIAAVATGIVVTTFMGSAGTAKQTSVLAISNASIVVNPDTGLGFVTVNLKNEGTGIIRINSITVTSDNGSVNVGSLPASLNPSQSGSFTANTDANGNGVVDAGENTFTIGRTYLVTVSGVDQSNKPVTTSTQVIASLS